MTNSYNGVILIIVKKQNILYMPTQQLLRKA
nr:MAG TPA: hypothetical protein [Caudoviricetes sp.]